MKSIKETVNGRRAARLLPRTVGLVAPALVGVLGAFWVPPAAAENGVEIYGIVDVGLMHQSQTPGGNGSKTSMETSGITPSLIGFRGTRDLKNGLTGFINLEAHFDTNDGAFHTGGDGVLKGKDGLFRRQSNVGVAGSWGSVTLGRQYGPALLAHMETEPRGFKENFSNLFSWAYTQLVSTSIPGAMPGTGASGTNTNNDVGVFFNNAIQFRSKVGSVDYGVMYSLGNQAGNVTNNSVIALGATYHGPVILSGSYQVMRDRDTSTDNVKHAGLGLAVPYGDVAFKGNFWDTKGEDSSGAQLFDVRSVGLGVDWKWAPQNSMTVAYYNNKDKLHTSNNTRNWVLSNDYSWDKDTTLYAQVAFVSAGGGATGLNGLLTTIVASGNSTGRTNFVNVGLNYKF